MENITLIKRIEAYLTHTLSSEEAVEFESEMAKDPGLGKLVEQYRQTFKVLQQQWLSMGVKAASGSLQLIKVIKVSVLSIIGIVAISLLFFNRGDFAKSNIGSTKTDTTGVILPVTNTDIKTIDTINLFSPLPAPIKISQQSGMENKNEISLIDQLESSDNQNLRIEKLINDYRNTLMPDTQYFSILNLKDTILYGIAGTKIDIYAGSLINFKTQKPVTGNIKIALCEFNNYFSMYSISTVCNDSLLQSGGSCYLSAKENQDSVYIKQDKPLKFGFECAKKNTEMSTFYGVKDANGVVRWENSENKSQIPETVNADSIHIPGSFSNSVTYDTLYFKRSYKQISATTRREVYLHWYVNPVSNTSQTFFSDTKSHKNWGEYVLQPVIRYPYSSKILGTIYNIIYANKFGYINCDHFLKYNNVENIHIYAEDTIIESYLFFKKIRSCLPSYQGIFSNVPHKSEVLVLTIFTRNNKLFMSFTETQTSSIIRINNPEPLDTKKIKSELKMLNK